MHSLREMAQFAGILFFIYGSSTLDPERTRQPEITRSSLAFLARRTDPPGRPSPLKSLFGWASSGANCSVGIEKSDHAATGEYFYQKILARRNQQMLPISATLKAGPEAFSFFHSYSLRGKGQRNLAETLVVDFEQTPTGVKVEVEVIGSTQRKQFSFDILPEEKFCSEGRMLVDEGEGFAGEDAVVDGKTYDGTWLRLGMYDRGFFKGKHLLTTLAIKTDPFLRRVTELHFNQISRSLTITGSRKDEILADVICSAAGAANGVFPLFQLVNDDPEFIIKNPRSEIKTAPLLNFSDMYETNEIKEVRGVVRPCRRISYHNDLQTLRVNEKKRFDTGHRQDYTYYSEGYCIDDIQFVDELDILDAPLLDLARTLKGRELVLVFTELPFDRSGGTKYITPETEINLQNWKVQRAGRVLALLSPSGEKWF